MCTSLEVDEIFITCQTYKFSQKSSQVLGLELVLGENSKIVR